MNRCLWTPSDERVKTSQLSAFIDFLKMQDGLTVTFSSYSQLHAWSVQHKADFWKAIWAFFGVRGTPGETVLLDEQAMPGASWFPEARLNFADNLLNASSDSSRLAIIERGEHGRRETLTYAQLREQVAKVAEFLKSHNVGQGDCVAGLLPNSQYAVIAMLATASLGAIWTSCSPDFGVQGVLDRFQQTRPKVLFACDGYYYANKVQHCLDKIDEIRSALPGLKACIIVPYLNREDQQNLMSHTLWSELLQADASPLRFEKVAFNSPLYILYSSGTTGKPKCIVHSVGGTLLQHIKELGLHSDVKAGTPLFYYTTCGWMMWNWLVSGLSLGATLVLWDGSPFHPAQSQLFDLIDEESIEIFGGSAKYYAACEKFELHPAKSHSLASLKTLLSTGSPLSPESFDYLYTSVKHDMCVSSISGGTDIISCFALGCPTLPVYRGELQCLGLGMDVQFVDDEGHALADTKGELVCRSPFPSMPVGFWNDPDGEKYQQAYFERFPGIWAHGDYGQLCQHLNDQHQLTQTGVMIHGRSDAVLNPGGVRIGTAEIYRQVEKIPAVFESLAIGQQWKDDVRIILFVRLQDGMILDDTLIDEIKQSIRRNTTPRHVPAKIIQVSDIPRTLSGKIVELAVKKIVEGLPVNNTEALANPQALALYKNLPELQLD
jgi:acetoacetyl-CoA synthetase